MAESALSWLCGNFDTFELNSSPPNQRYCNRACYAHYSHLFVVHSFIWLCKFESYHFCGTADREEVEFVIVYARNALLVTNLFALGQPSNPSNQPAQQLFIFI